MSVVRGEGQGGFRCLDCGEEFYADHVYDPTCPHCGSQQTGYANPPRRRRRRDATDEEIVERFLKNHPE